MVVDYLHKLLASKILTGHGSHEDAECLSHCATRASLGCGFRRHRLLLLRFLFSRKFLSN